MSCIQITSEKVAHYVYFKFNQLSGTLSKHTGSNYVHI